MTIPIIKNKSDYMMTKFLESQQIKLVVYCEIEKGVKIQRNGTLVNCLSYFSSCNSITI